MKLKYTSWNDVTVEDYFKIQEMVKQEYDEIEKDVDILSFFYSVTPDDIWNLPVDEVGRLKKALSWLTDGIKFDIKQRHFKSLKIDNQEYKIDTDTSKMTYAQYVDFQSSWKGLPEDADNMVDVLACFIIPKGKKYGEGYDVLKMKEELKQLPISTATSICFFFLKKSVTSIKSFLIYSKVMMKMMKWKMRKKLKKEDREIFQQLIDNLKEMEAQFTVG